MADQKQLNLLKDGVEQWNAWREAKLEAKLEVEVDLSEAYLRDADLRNAKLSRANLKICNNYQSRKLLYSGND